jgi:mannose/fructose/N-acetylgalactosamine-specific phosphotransferase system component IIC
MTDYRRTIILSLGLLGATLSTPAQAITQSATVQVNINRPLTLTALQNLNLGTLTLAGGTWSNVTVGISRTGVLTCSNTNVVCSGTTATARYKVTGTNKQVVTIAVPNVTLTNQIDTTKTLTMVADAPSSVSLTSSGMPGIDFDIGGSIILNSATADGTYTGTMNVTVDYQ